MMTHKIACHGMAYVDNSIVQVVNNEKLTIDT